MRSQIQVQESFAAAQTHVMDYVMLAKPELTLLSVLTAVGGAYLASGYAVRLASLLHVFLGTLLVGGGAGALNQFIERRYDALMRRTEHRPMPAGRVRPGQAMLFGILIALTGVIDLAHFTNVLTGFLAVVTLVTYLFLYTPLKRITPFATVVGGIPGALPPVIGWAAVRGDLSIQAWSLFAIVFFWQMPHFLSLAWMYRKDYARGGYMTLPVVDPEGTVTRRQILVYSLALLPASALPTYVGLAGLTYFVGAIVLALTFLGMALHFAVGRTSTHARRLFLSSLAYLPALILLAILDRL
jgi:protoheme IX farnesyltransferase